MVAFRLPKNSKVDEGRSWDAPDGAARVRSFRVYRWNPDDGLNPRMDTYRIDLDDCGPMVLDALIKIKDEIDPTLTFRRSCREGVCGSCSMNIDGANTLACILPIAASDDPVKVYPLPHQPVVKDLVPDLDNFYAQLRSIQPWLRTDAPPADGEWRQSPVRARQARRSVGMHPQHLLLDLLPQLLVERRPLPRPGHPAAGLSLDRRQPRRGDGERLEDLDDPFKLYRCHTILNCAQACPKGLNPAKAIADVKKMMVEREA
jgi:succinate dehydrogenase / fumarate reductase iron-sulfur subunit